MAPQRVVDRILDRLDTSGDCWIWPGSTSSGYGRVAWSIGAGQKIWRSTHRVVYSHFRGVIPAGLDLDHLCHNPDECHPETADQCPHRPCCNPDHLEPVSRRVNLLRGGTVPADRSKRTHCPQGHEYTIDNTLTDKLSRRSCKECTYEKNRAYYWRNRERRSEYNRQWRMRNIKVRAS